MEREREGRSLPVVPGLSVPKLCQRLGYEAAGWDSASSASVSAKAGL